ncbi:MAG TPA: response regulator, partial [Acidobacteriaceae bacterium]
GAEAAEYLFRTGAYADRLPGNPAVVLLDLKLPKVDGLELLQMVRANEGTRQTPVVLLTSSREERDVVSGYRLGVNAYVVKPVEFRAFVQAIQDLGTFWAVWNEPPPGSARVVRHG